MQTSENNEYKHGRGSQFNTANRFLKNSLVREHIEGIDEWVETKPNTQIFEEQAKNIVNKVDSPDVGMFYSVNPYQGCEHGCIYCYARNAHEYWGFSAGLDFESKIIVKKNAPELLRKWFNNPKWQPLPISFSGNTDCYQPLERQFKITRQLLEVCLEYGNPCGIISKNALILRDLDILKQLAAKNLVRVFISITTLDESLRLIMEPRTVTAKQRLNVLNTLSKAGIPVGVMTAPIIPGLNISEIPTLIEAAALNGATAAGYTVVRLNGAIGPLFKDWLYKNFPARADKVWHQIEACHGGNVNDNRFGKRMRGDGAIAENIAQMHRLACKKHFTQNIFSFNFSAFRRPGVQQLSLF